MAQYFDSLNYMEGCAVPLERRVPVFRERSGLLRLQLHKSSGRLKYYLAMIAGVIDGVKIFLAARS